MYSCTKLCQQRNHSRVCVLLESWQAVDTWLAVGKQPLSGYACHLLTSQSLSLLVSLVHYPHSSPIGFPEWLITTALIYRKIPLHSSIPYCWYCWLWTSCHLSELIDISATLVVLRETNYVEYCVNDVLWLNIQCRHCTTTEQTSVADESFYCLPAKWRGIWFRWRRLYVCLSVCV